MLYDILLIVFLLVSIALVALILVQQGKGADMGSAFGAGASNTLFGSSGAGSFLTKLTQGLAVSFFALALTLGAMTQDRANKGSQYENIAGEPSQVSAMDATVETNGDLPVADIPATDIPATDIPATDIPATEVPATQTEAATESDKEDK